MKKLIIGIFTGALFFIAGTAFAYSTGTISTSKSSCYIPLGASTCKVDVSWNTTDPVYPSALTVGVGNVVAVSNFGTKIFDIPYGGLTFNLYNGNLLLTSTNVTSSCISGTNWNGTRCVPNINPTYSCLISDFTVNGGKSSLIFPGDPVTLYWLTSNCSYVNITGVGSNLPPNGSQLLYPTQTTTYTINGFSSTGAVSMGKNVSVSVSNQYNNDGYSNIPTPIYNLKAVTSIATNITSNSANLNALMTNISASSANVYFEYGKTVKLGLKTQEQNINSNINFSEVVKGLSPNTIYYFRAVSKEDGQISLGKIEIFKTLSSQISTSSSTKSKNKTTVRVVNSTAVKQVVNASTTSNSNLLSLTISNKYKAIGQGDVIEYTILYKNNSKVTLIDPILQIIVPDGINITNSSAGGVYDRSSKTLKVELGNLAPGETEIIYTQAKVNSFPPNVSQFITTSLMTYTTKISNSKQNVLAYVLNTPKKKAASSLGATTAYSGITGISFIDLLFILILILLVVLVISKYFYSSKTVEVLHKENKEK